MEMLILLQTLRLDSASRVTAVIPYLCYARSDKKDQPRVPITARLVADMIQVAGADRYITLDLHAGQIRVFSDPGGCAFCFPHPGGLHEKQTGPDAKSGGGDGRPGVCQKGAQLCSDPNVPMAFIEKRRTANDAKSQALSLIGDVTGRDVIIVDDEVDTGGSITQAVNLVKECGARDVYMSFVHPLFSLNAAERLAALPVKEMITTDTVPIPPEKMALFGAVDHPLGFISGGRSDPAGE